MNDLATPQQLKKISALLHRKAEIEHKGYGYIRDRFKEDHDFTNFSKLSKREISSLIDGLEDGIASPKNHSWSDCSGCVHWDQNGECCGKYTIQELIDMDQRGLKCPSYESRSAQRTIDIKNDCTDGEVKEYVDLYSTIWQEVLANKALTNLNDRECSIVAAGIFREITKDRRTERIGELRNGGEQ